MDLLITYYNRPHELSRLMASLNLDNFQRVLIYDDCSIKSVPKRFHDDVRLEIISGLVNVGAQMARNRLLRMATAKYVMVFDCDDEYIGTADLSVTLDPRTFVAIPYGTYDRIRFYGSRPKTSFSLIRHNTIPHSGT